MRRLRLVLEYDGTDFCGFQRQPGTRTIQGTLEERLSGLCGHAVHLVAAGRTDAGVHALGQVVHFDTTGRIPAERVAIALNALDGRELVVRYAEETTAAFHARFSARARTYRYYVTREQPTPLLARYVAFDRQLPEGAAERMRAALPAILGEHDFATFAAAGSEAASTVRTIYRAEIEERGPLLRFEVTADAFLHGMVRALMGLLLEIGRGRQEPDAMARALAARNRAAAPFAAPAHGLILLRVDYPDGFPPPEARVAMPDPWQPAPGKAGS